MNQSSSNTGYGQAGLAPVMQDGVQLPVYPNQDSAPLVVRGSPSNAAQPQQSRAMTPREHVFERHRKHNLVKYTLAVAVFTLGSVLSLITMFVDINTRIGGVLGLAVMCALFWFFYETFYRPDWRKYKVYSYTVGLILLFSFLSTVTTLLAAVIYISIEVLWAMWLADAIVSAIASVVLIFLCILRWKRLSNPNWRFGVPSRPRRRRSDDDYTRLEDIFYEIPPERQ